MNIYIVVARLKNYGYQLDTILSTWKDAEKAYQEAEELNDTAKAEGDDCAYGVETHELH